MRQFCKVHTSRGTDYANRIFEILSTHSNGTEYNLRDVAGGRGAFRMLAAHTYKDQDIRRYTLAVNKTKA